MLHITRHILVGKNEKYKTIQKALNRYPRGKLVIELTSDIMDEEDIHVSKSLKKLVIKSSVENEPRIFLKSNIVVYLHNVETHLEDIGVENVPTGYIIGSIHRDANIKLSLIRCNLRSVIGAFETKKLKQFDLHIQKSQIVCICGSYESDVDSLIGTMNIVLDEVQGACIQLFSKSKCIEQDTKRIRLDMNKCSFEHISTFQASQQNQSILDCQIKESFLQFGVNTKEYNAYRFLMRAEGCT